MEVTGNINVLGFRIPVLVALTSLVGALAIVVSYAAGLFSRGNKNANSNKALTNASGRNGDGERRIGDPRNSMNDDSSAVSQNVGTSTTTSANSNGNTMSGKRAKNKKRREAQQEFAHPWMVGALKGHTGSVLDMNFSSNGKFLASCAEDCDLVPEEEPELGDASSSSGEGDYVLEAKSRSQGIPLGSGNSNPPTATVVVTSNSNNNSNKNNSSKGNNDTFVSPARSSNNELEKVRSSSSSSSSLSPATNERTVVAGDRASLSRRQRKNRTRAPREQQRARDRDDENDDLAPTSKPRHRHHHRMHHQPEVTLRHIRHESPTQVDRTNCNPTKSGNPNSSRNNRKSSDIPKSLTVNDAASESSLKTGITQISRVNYTKSGVHAIPGKITKNSSIYRSGNDHQSIRNHRDQLNQLSESALASLMKRYVLGKSQCITHGYPIEFDRLIDCVYIKHFQRPSMMDQPNVPWYHHLDANAREFVPSNGAKGNAVKSAEREWTPATECEIDSGTGSASSVESSDQEPECSSDSDKSSDIGESFSSSSSASSSSSSLSTSSSSSGYSEKMRRDSATNLESCDSGESNSSLVIVERECARCMTNFSVNGETGEYIQDDKCVYHWGKLLSSPVPGVQPKIWECCQSVESTKGCTSAGMHVWTGLSPGYNGPFYNYVKTQPSRVFATDGNYGVYALDCEMCFTRWGLELTRVTVVSMTGRVIYDTLVKPHDEIIDYNTRFSGITAETLAQATKTLEDVQKDILSFVYAETILIGHGLGNDLRALRILHRNVIDTTVIYPHVRGFPVRRSLKTLARSVLGREIQVTEHDSVEDARTAAEIMIAKIWSDIY